MHYLKLQDTKELNRIMAAVVERKRQILGTLSRWNPLYLATIWIQRMRETGVKDNCKILRPIASGILVILLTEFGKLQEGSACGEITEQLGKMDFTHPFFP